MRHQKKTVKLGRTAEHRKALLANQVCSLIEHHRIRTTLAKAKAVRPLAEKMLTLGKRGDLHARRTAISYLRDADKVKILFEKIAPAAANRTGGYTRIVKIGQRTSDAAEMAYLEWVDLAVALNEPELEEVASEPKAKAKAKTKAPKTEKEPKEPKAAKEAKETKEPKAAKEPKESKE